MIHIQIYVKAMFLHVLRKKLLDMIKVSYLWVQNSSSEKKYFHVYHLQMLIPRYLNNYLM